MGNSSLSPQRACTHYWLGLCRLCQFALLTLVLSAQAVWATTIDIMLVYDNTATSWVASNGGMATFSQDTISRMNLAMQNSNVDITFRLVHAMSVNYTTTSGPSSPLNDDLEALQRGAGVFAAVHAARTSHGADLVAMLVDHGSAYGYVGVGYILTSSGGSPNYAFTVNAIQSVAISHTLTHEVGHNLGAAHAQNQAQSPGPNRSLAPYSAGYYFTGNTDSIKYHTIMAYDWDGYGNSYISAPLFSTPLISYQGTIAGNAAIADNSRLLRETKAIVAAYREELAGYSYLIPYFRTGPGHWTGVALSNMGPAAAQVTLTAYSASGSIASTQAYQIPVNGQDARLFPEGITSLGWIKIQSSQILYGLSFNGDITYNFMYDIPVFSATAQQMHVPHIAQNSQWDTDLYLVNAGQTSASVVIQVYSSVGTLVGSATRYLPALTSQAVNLGAIGITNLASGRLEITSSQPIAAFSRFSDVKSGGRSVAGINAVIR